MSIQKDCADRLRESYRALTGKKLRSGHAHELAAAYFGYGSAAALQSESKYPLSELDQASILIPDIVTMDARRGQLAELPSDLQSSRELANEISNLLETKGHFSGKIWDSEYLSDDINGYVQDDPMIIENELSGQIAETNAYFDELYLDDVEVAVSDDGFVATIAGSLNGDQDEDRVFHGDKIKFTSVMTMDRIAGRVAYTEPDFETGGEVDMEDYYDPEP